MASFRTLPILALLLPGICASSQGQVAQLEPGTDIVGPGDLLGSSLCNEGDIDGDGWDDIVVGAPRYDWAGGIDAGAVLAYSGRTADLLWARGGTPGECLGTALDVVGDLNGDGHPEFIVASVHAEVGTAGSGPKGRVTLLSGADGAPIWSEDGSQHGDWFGIAVSGTGDLNSDGWPDFMVGAHFADDPLGAPTGSLTVYSGQDRSVLHTLYGDAALADFGTACDVISDLDDDGVDDLLVGAHEGHQVVGVDNGGYVLVISGATGEEIHRIDNDVPGESFGRDVAALGDVNGDGVADFAVGCNEEHETQTGYVNIYSGVDFALLASFQGEAQHEEFGFFVAGPGDMDGDGAADLAVAAPQHGSSGVPNGGKVTVYSVMTGGVIFEKVGDSENDHIGRVAGGGDVNGDGFADLLVGAPEQSSQTGRVWSFLGLPADCVNSPASEDGDGDGIPDDCEDWFDLGKGLVGHLGQAPALQGEGFLVGGMPMRLSLDHALAGAFATLILGLDELCHPFKGGFLVPTIDLLVPGFVTDPSGSIVLELEWPVGIPSGTTMFLQWWIVDAAGPFGLTASNGVRGEAH